MLTDEEAAAIEAACTAEMPLALALAFNALLADRRERIEREARTAACAEDRQVALARLEAWTAEARYWFRSVAEPGGNGITQLRAETLLADPAGQAAEARVAEREAQTQATLAQTREALAGVRGMVAASYENFARCVFQAQATGEEASDNDESNLDKAELAKDAMLNALALPQDRTALDAMIAEARREGAEAVRRGLLGIQRIADRYRASPWGEGTLDGSTEDLAAFVEDAIIELADARTSSRDALAAERAKTAAAEAREVGTRRDLEEVGVAFAEYAEHGSASGVDVRSYIDGCAEKARAPRDRTVLDAALAGARRQGAREAAGRLAVVVKERGQEFRPAREGEVADLILLAVEAEAARIEAGK